MNGQNISWFGHLEQLIEQKHMLKHPFYKAWTHGTLSMQTLQTYAREYYQHVKAFPTYLSALHSQCEDQGVRKCLLGNLIDEEAGQPNHPDLWKSFTMALGVERQDIEAHTPRRATQELIASFRECCRSQPLSVGIAALYCYESQIPAICHEKIDGLKKWYGMTDPKGYRYFSLHETVDIEHAQEEKDLLLAHVGPGDEKAVLKGAEKTLDALNNFLSSFLD